MAAAAPAPNPTTEEPKNISPFEIELQRQRQIEWLTRHLEPAENVWAMSDDERRERAAEIKSDIANFAGRNYDALAGGHPINRWLKSGCPALHGAHLDRLNPVPAGWINTLHRLMGRAQAGGGYLIPLLGNRGTGKTQLAVSLIRKCCLVMECRYITAADFFREIRATFSPDSPVNERTIFERFGRVPLLVIDEVHQRAETLAENNALIQLIDRRYSAMLDTVLIANQSREAFAASLGSSVVSRIHEIGEVIDCAWESFRTPSAQRQAAA